MIKRNQNSEMNVDSHYIYSSLKFMLGLPNLKFSTIVLLIVRRLESVSLCLDSDRSGP